MSLEKKYEDMFSDFKMLVKEEQHERNLTFDKQYADFLTQLKKSSEEVDQKLKKFEAKEDHLKHWFDLQQIEIVGQMNKLVLSKMQEHE